ncbi:hypothetical protein [Salicibibacter kimchii]|uniref:Uncharacterized protein n=1 Tax=Salicibibacter kimchii TaxID=2099786 RepID=A0A345BW35_9BACI|nr:hypothetical protein [Salicibibacter kimchii]AXF55166.1 hypothetical protein DT065_03465 [Salicibibacter kimchii]
MPIRKADIKLFLLAHLQEIDCLPVISAGLLDEDLQQAVGFEVISPSQLSRKHRGVDPSLLSTIFVGSRATHSALSPKIIASHAVKNH